MLSGNICQARQLKQTHQKDTKYIIPLFAYTVALLKCCFVFLSAQFIPLMSKFHGPKCQEMRFPAFQFSRIFRGSMLPDPPRNDGLKPIVWVLRTHNRLLFQTFRLLKNLYTTLFMANMLQSWFREIPRPEDTTLLFISLTVSCTKTNVLV